MSEVKFLDYFTMNISEGILQVRTCQRPSPKRRM